MITQEELRKLLNIYLVNNKKSIRKASIESKISYPMFFRFTKGERNLGYNNLLKLYNYLHNI